MSGLTGYYQKFIAAYAHLVCLLTQMTYKAVPFIWTD